MRHAASRVLGLPQLPVCNQRNIVCQFTRTARNFKHITITLKMFRWLDEQQLINPATKGDRPERHEIQEIAGIASASPVRSSLWPLC